MVMSTKGVAELYSYIQKQFEREFLAILNGTACKRYFFDLMTESINTVVYNGYSPSRYERRFERGGLIDEGNYRYEAFKSGSSFVVEMRNMTESNNDDGVKFLIDEGIIGKIPHFYDWKSSRIYQIQESNGGVFPRDFYEYMRQADDRELRNIIVREMGKSQYFN